MLSPGSSSLQSSEQGLIPRVVHDLYARVRVAAGRGVTVTTKVSYIEIYNEELFDLLGRGSAANLAATAASAAVSGATAAGFGRGAPTVSSGISIREEVGGGVVLVGVREELVSSYTDIARALTRGTAGRTTGSTRMNTHSSRSHCIFTINIEQRCEGVAGGGGASTSSSTRGKSSRNGGAVVGVVRRKDEVTKSSFRLVDLAGSERAKRTGAQGVRFQESVSINRGLLALANVISALIAPGRDKHVPYRSVSCALRPRGFGCGVKTSPFAQRGCIYCVPVSFALLFFQRFETHSAAAVQSGRQFAHAHAGVRIAT
jgi:kinesin family protein 4/21/27